jgi:hypothetical protein
MKREQLVLRSNVESKKGAALKVISFDLSASGHKALSSGSSRQLPSASPTRAEAVQTAQQNEAVRVSGA